MRRISKKRAPVYSSKRGGSSGGRSGGLNNPESNTYKAVFRTATLAEIDSNISDWDKELKEMSEAASGLENKYSKVDSEILNDSRWIARTVRNSTVKNRIGIKDNKGNIQAAAIYKREIDHIYIGYLATAPWNFTSDSRAVKGAGTQAIIEAIKLDKAKGGTGEVRLEALERALPFYKKLGFKATFTEKDLKLSAADANKLLEKLGEA